ncbi:hypothetical protein F2P56_002736 [Juglans regia]|uniref:MAPK kinase substrate protein At1g80180-like n=2 Tax=Juglans regia TaxID=51240 RepID=A0A833YGK2_JUGRE|nr:uncharacterized protein At1g15400 [Juglans regia]KAF5482145.1 hypothetical protein F2P56_002736 [Juglans regia]
MAGLQRSSTSFRRQGSSGLVWNDQFLSGDLRKSRHNNQEDFNKENDVEYRDLRPSRSVGSIGLMERRGRFTGGTECRTVKVPPPTVDPPSPKVAGCGLCGIFGKPTIVNQPKSNNMRRSK